MAYGHNQRVLVLGLTPEFLDKPVLWFSHNESRIIEAQRIQGAFRERVVILERGMRVSLPFLLRTLDELGYEKVLEIASFGEFAARGGIVDIFPLNREHPVRIEFVGNAIETIDELPRDSLVSRAQLKKRLEKQREETEALGDLKAGDFVVHLDHGIGRYSGKTKIHIPNAEEQEYFSIEYADGDKLYVPTRLARKLSLYVGFHEPKIHRLGGSLWLKTKRRAKEDAIAFAKELLELYAQREVMSRPPYPPDDELQAQFESAFAYELTPDQIRAVAAIKSDMQRTIPMDRLVCGDVAFGKTEVAMRALFKAVTAGKQTALLCPTTILADQHFLTFKKRFHGFPISIAVLTRLQTKREQRTILEKLRVGAIDIVIGTHRLLSKDVEFKRLGLLVIDEEQRFGVRQKEKLKNLRTELDVLSLSATPIPRTLSFALANLKPVSRIQTPPPGRKSIATFVLQWNAKTVKDAIEKERERDGQVYFLHNRILTIKKFSDRIERLAPKVRIASLHGKSGERTLLGTMRRLRNREIDVLIATTIIENGLDIDTVNTLIVEDATKLGLGQAYQLRGRIGRGEEQAYAYFFFKPKALSEKARMRLDALKEAEKLGSGYRLALRDLEIRGAGNLLGKEQSGTVNRVGFNLYCQMLSEAVEQLRES